MALPDALCSTTSIRGDEIDILHCVSFTKDAYAGGQHLKRCKICGDDANWYNRLQTTNAEQNALLTNSFRV